MNTTTGLCDKHDNGARLYRQMLQTSWARGRSLADGLSPLWLKVPKSLEKDNVKEFWSRLQTLPQRAGWMYEEDPPWHWALHLVERFYVIPGRYHRYRQAWQGAEAGLRERDADQLFPQASRLWHHADWRSALSIMQQNDLSWDVPFATIPAYHQATMIETVFREKRVDYWALDLFSDSTGALRRCVLAGLLWPGEIWWATAAAWRDGAGYRREARMASAWLAMTTALAVIAETPEFEIIFSTVLRRLPSHSQIRAVGEWTLEEFGQGTSWSDWQARLAKRCHYYPADHVVPNVAGIVAAILWGHSQWDKVLSLAWQDGYDPITRALITGALLGIADEPLPRLPEHLIDQLNQYGDETFAASHGTHGVRP